MMRELHGAKMEANISKKNTDPDHKKNLIIIQN